MTEPADPTPGDFALGDLVTDGVWVAMVVIDVDAGTALPPLMIDEWKFLGRGVMIDTREAGLVHYTERTDLRRA